LLSSKKALVETLAKIAQVNILVVGDLILDRYVWGGVDRISPEAPVPVVEVRRTEDRLGGAANTARNLRRIGAQVNLCGFIGDDDEGSAILGLLDRDGIIHEGVIADRTRPTTLKTRIIAQSQQIVRIDRESRVVQAVAMREGFAAVVESQIESVQGIILSDYGKGTISEPLIRILDSATTNGKIGLRARPLIVDPHPANYGIYRTMSVVKPNRKEAEQATGIKIHNRDSAVEAARALLKKWSASLALITMGEDGLMLLAATDPDPIFLDTMAQEVFDVSGAGDTVTAVFAAALATGADKVVAGDLANLAAGIVVSEVGTVAVDPVRLRHEIDRLAK